MDLRPHSNKKQRLGIIGLATYRSRTYLKLMNYGKLALARGHSETALRFFERAHRLRPGTRTFSLLAWAYAVGGKLSMAKTLALQSHQLNPGHASPCNDFGSFLLQEGKSHEAMQWFEKAKNAPFCPRPETAFINTARAYLVQKNYRAAILEFKKALDLVPGHSDLKEIIFRLKQKLKGLPFREKHH